MSEHHHQYGLPDLRQLVAGRAHFQGTQQGNEPFFVQSRNLVPQTHHFESIMVGHEAMLPSGLVKLGGRHHDHYCTNATNITTNNTITSATIGTSSSAGAGTLYGVEMENATAAGWIGNDGGNNSRWPRQETLTLLEIRSRLDSRFKEANQKGPLWDEVSRIMAEEHGYQRSGKKCREKFENLYKYYKKTKEGKAGRQDGKHYRFFRQLEALYGEPSNQAPASETHFANNTLLYQTPLSNTINQESQETFQENKHSESLSFSNTSEFETSSSENNDDDLSAIAYNMMNRSTEKQKGVNESQSLAGPKKSWRTKVEDFVDSQMRKLMEKQDAWMEKMLKTIEDREYERMCREEEWTKQELARFDREHEFWAKERAWIESRDSALMEALKKHAEKGPELSSSVEHIAVATQRHNNNQDSTSAKKIQKDKFNNIIWTEPEILSFIQLRTSMESRFQESGYSNEGLWEEIAEEMASLGYDRSVDECKEKWESMNIYLNMTTESNKKRKDQDLRTNDYFQLLESYNGMNSSPSNSYLGTQVNDNSCFQVQINEGDQQQHLWNTNKFDLKLNKEKNQQVWHNCGDEGYGRKVFDKMRVRNVVSWTTFIAGLVVCGDLDAARRAFDQMPTRNVVSWTAIINAYVRNQRPHEAFELFWRMLLANVKPNEYTLVNLLKACSELGSLKLGRWIHDYALKNEFDLGAFLGTALIDMYSKCGSLDDARQVFREMQIKSLATWNAMITSLGVHGYGEEALSLFTKMEEANVRPDAITFVGVICACLQTDKVREGDMYFKYMREHYGITPVVEHYTCMIELYSRANLLNALDELVKGMPRELSDDVAAAWIKSRLIDDIDDTENSLEHQGEELQYWETRTEHLSQFQLQGFKWDVG